MTRGRFVLSLTLACGLSARALPAQTPAQIAAAAPAEAADVAAGWAAVASGDLDRANVLAAAVVSRYPRSLPAANLFIQTQTLRAGAAAGLAAYEQWQGAKPSEAPYLLRVVALGLLREAVRGTPPGDPQQRAVRALTDEGDTATLAALAENSQPGNLIGLQIQGALGNEPAVRSLISSMRNIPGDRSRSLKALAATKSPLAVAPMLEVLTDPMMTNRIAAADALGDLGRPEAVERLRPLLKGEEQFAFRFAVARALFRLHDSAGTAFLRDLENSPHAMIRAQALEATSSAADATWVSSVRPLLSDSDPMVRLLAARLIAPYDGAAAIQAVQGLLNDGNIGVREAAAMAYADRIAADFPTLRLYLHNSSPVVRVNAAARILELTR
jgi:HEAT repeat protein